MGKWQHAKAIIALPGLVTILVPVILIIFTFNLGFGWSLGFPFNLIVFIVGGALIGIGLVLFIKTNLLFAEIGDGTLAPWDPPKKLVVRGIYRYVRNPMITGVLFILLGEAVLFGSLFILLEFGIFLAINHVYFVNIVIPPLTPIAASTKTQPRKVIYQGINPDIDYLRIVARCADAPAPGAIPYPRDAEILQAAADEAQDFVESSLGNDPDL